MPRRNDRSDSVPPLELTPLDIAPLPERIKHRPGDYRSQLNPAQRARLEQADARAALKECAMPLCKQEPIWDYRKGNLGICEQCASDVISWHQQRTESLPEVNDALVKRVHRVRREEEALQRQAERRALTPGWIYYVRVDDRIKIGFSTDVRQRMRAYPPHAELVAVHPGTKTTERDMHAQFKNVLAAGREWFHPTSELLEHIQTVVDQFGQPPQHMIYKFRDGTGGQTIKVHRSSRAHHGRRR